MVTLMSSEKHYVGLRSTRSNWLSQGSVSSLDSHIQRGSKAGASRQANGSSLAPPGSCPGTGLGPIKGTHWALHVPTALPEGRAVRSPSRRAAVTKGGACGKGNMRFDFSYSFLFHPKAETFIWFQAGFSQPSCRIKQTSKEELRRSRNQK